MAEATVHIVPDTNQSLHWKRLDQIDWLCLTGATKCVLHIAPVLLRELEEQKVHNKSEKLRERASDTVRWLANLSDQPDPIVLRPGVELAFIEHEPTTIDFAASRLSERIADDFLIATALDLAGRLGVPVSIASGDTGLKVKLRSRRMLSFLPLPETDKLPTELDRDQKELRELRVEIARLKTRQPKLAVVLPNGETHIVVKLQREFSKLPSLDDIKRSHPFLEEDITEAQPIISGLRSIRFDRNAEYNKRLNHYYAEYSQYEAQMREFRAFLQRAFDISFQVQNVGRAPANQIDVMITFPSHVRLMRRSDVPEVPSAPEVPKQGCLSISDVIRSSFDPSKLAMPIDFHQDGTPYINQEKNMVEYSVSALKHEFNHTLGSVVAVFEPGLKPSSFEATFLVACNEIDSEEGTLRFVIE